MTQVLAAAPDECEGAHDVAAAMAAIIGADVRVVAPGLAGDPTADTFLTELATPEAVLGVIVPDPGHEAASWRVVQRSDKPVIMVPRHFVVRSVPAVSRVLVPLDGSKEAATTVCDTMRLFADAEVELIVLHVFDVATTPRFWDQAAHARHGWERQFRESCAVPPKTRLELRRGEPAQRVVDVAAAEHPDLVTLGWSQNLAPGRARTVLHTVRDADLPVMLLPVR